MKIEPLQHSLNIGLNDRKTFDWPSAEAVLVKVTEELNELKSSLKEPKTSQVHELGDLLFTVAQVARHLNIDPNIALDLANQRYLARMIEMKEILKKENLSFENQSVSQLEKFWQKAKQNLKTSELAAIQDYLKSK